MKNGTRIALAALLSLLGSPLLHATLSYSVTIDTTPLDGVSGYMAFDLYGGNGFNNVATITGFSSDSFPIGTSCGDPSVTCTNDVAGSLTPGPLTLTSDPFFFNEWLQQVTFGHLTTFTLNVTTAFTSGTPDSFAFFLLDSTQTPYGTSDPTGADSIFAIDLVGDSNTTPQVFTSTNIPSSFTATVTPSTTPEPSPATTVGLGLAVILALRFLPKRRRGMCSIRPS
jgi:hypothetical protein